MSEKKAFIGQGTAASVGMKAHAPTPETKPADADTSLDEAKPEYTVSWELHIEGKP